MENCAQSPSSILLSSNSFFIFSPNSRAGSSNTIQSNAPADILPMSGSRPPSGTNALATRKFIPNTRLIERGRLHAFDIDRKHDGRGKQHRAGGRESMSHDDSPFPLNDYHDSTSIRGNNAATSAG